MDLILWRHAEALDTLPDMQRTLTERGQRQAKVMAEWLRPRLPRNTRVLVSPAVRAQQTAAALTESFETLRNLSPEACVPDLIAASGWPTGARSTLIVGHQPTLGRLAALLLGGEEHPWSIRKGAVWWLNNRERDTSMQVVLRCSISPDFLT